MLWVRTQNNRLIETFLQVAKTYVSTDGYVTKSLNIIAYLGPGL